MNSFPHSVSTTHTCLWGTDGRSEHCVEKGKVFEGFSEKETETNVMLCHVLKPWSYFQKWDIGYIAGHDLCSCALKGDRVGARRVAAPNSKDTQGVLAPSHFKKRKKTRLSAQQGGPSHGCLLHMEHRKTLTSETHSTVRLNLGSFHGNGNAVQENDHQDDVIKHLVSDDFIAHQTESVERGKKKE